MRTLDEMKKMLEPRIAAVPGLTMRESGATLWIEAQTPGEHFAAAVGHVAVDPPTVKFGSSAALPVDVDRSLAEVKLVHALLRILKFAHGQVFHQGITPELEALWEKNWGKAHWFKPLREALDDEETLIFEDDDEAPTVAEHALHMCAVMQAEIEKSW